MGFCVAIDHLLNGEGNVQLKLHYMELIDSTNLIGLLNQIKPDKVYNLVEQSHIVVSFEVLEFTADTTGIGIICLLEAIK